MSEVSQGSEQPEGSYWQSQECVGSERKMNRILRGERSWEEEQLTWKVGRLRAHDLFD